MSGRAEGGNSHLDFIHFYVCVLHKLWCWLCVRADGEVTHQELSLSRRLVRIAGLLTGCVQAGGEAAGGPRSRV